MTGRAPLPILSGMPSRSVIRLRLYGDGTVARDVDADIHPAGDVEVVYAQAVPREPDADGHRRVDASADPQTGHVIAQATLRRDANPAGTAARRDERDAAGHTRGQIDAVLEYDRLLVLARLHDDGVAGTRCLHGGGDRGEVVRCCRQCRTHGEPARRVRRHRYDLFERPRQAQSGGQAQYQAGNQPRRPRRPRPASRTGGRLLHDGCCRRAGHCGGEAAAFDIDHADVVLAAGFVGRLDQRFDDPFGTTGASADDAVDGTGRQHVAQAIRAEQKRGPFVETGADHLDEIGIVRFVESAADVAEHFVAPRMPHRLGFGDLAGVLAFADRRVIVCELDDARVGQLVETRITDMADGQAVLGQQRERQDTGHAGPFGRALGLGQDLVVRQDDGFTDATLRRPEGTLQRVVR